MDQIDIAWFAGIFEADGHGRVTRSGGSLIVTMIQKDVIESIKSRLDIGIVYGPYGPTSAGNETWRWQCADRKELARICLGIYFLLGSYKKQQISDITDYLYDHISRPKNCIQCNEKYIPSSFRGASKKSKYCSNKCANKAWKIKMRDNK